ncbi:MAG: prephenate/arogenate dehydrogenase family protein [Pseudomonadota bacterium]
MERFNRLALIGVGLIGSSIALAARRANLVDQIVVQSRTPQSLEKARARGLADDYTTDAAEAVRDADLVIVCVPVGACGAIAEQIAPNLLEGALVSDVGSVKASVIASMGPHLPNNVHFVPAHPVAGTEHSGPDAGFADLFIDRWCILTPPPGSENTAVERLRDFWTSLGSNVEIMEAEHHDRVLAITSHIPHLIAYNIVGTAEDVETVTQSEVMKFSAGGFRDFTRIAASDPTMWRDVFLTNKVAVLDMLQRFTEDLSALQRAIRWGDGDYLYNLFVRTRDIRRVIIEAGQETDKPDFGRHDGTVSDGDASKKEAESGQSK